MVRVFVQNRAVPFDIAPPVWTEHVKGIKNPDIRMALLKARQDLPELCLARKNGVEAHVAFILKDRSEHRDAITREKGKFRIINNDGDLFMGSFQHADCGGKGEEKRLLFVVHLLIAQFYVTWSQFIGDVIGRHICAEEIAAIENEGDQFQILIGDNLVNHAADAPLTIRDI